MYESSSERCPLTVERATVVASGQLSSARALTDNIFAYLRPEAWFDRPIPERHRLIFYRGHLEAFDWNLLGVATLGRLNDDASLDQLFAFGIDPPPGQVPTDRESDWPSRQATEKYVGRTRSAIDEIATDVPRDVLDMAIEHRLMHAETLFYLLHQLPFDRRCVDIASRVTGLSGELAPPATFVPLKGGAVTLGRTPNGEFGWDNEFPSVELPVADFAIGRFKVTNGQYKKFVDAGGPVPPFWIERNGEWHYRGFFEEMPLPEDWPVYTTHQQASAFAAWSGAKLPSEAQWQLAAFGAADDPRRYPWGFAPMNSGNANANFLMNDLTGVRSTPGGDTPRGVSQLVGNGWEWTRTEFGPFPGFESHPSYPGYSANFFDGEHYVVKGASPATAERLIRPTFRNWFRETYPYAYTAFRLVKE